MSRQSSLIGTQKYTSPKPSVPITIPNHLPQTLADAESILPKHVAALTEAASASFAPWVQSSSSHFAQHALDTIHEPDEAMVDSDMDVVAKSDNPTHAVQSDDVPVLIEVQQPVQQQQEKSSTLELTQSANIVDLGMEQPVQQQAASDIVSEAAAAAEQRAYTPVQQPADSVEGVVVSVFVQQRAGAQGCSLASSQEGPWSSSVKVSDIHNCLVDVHGAV